MAGNTDFLALYQELGLSADCNLQDFKLAYRKRVSEIHPDRGPGNGSTVQGLQRLNGLYSSAMDFHRRHGRLPGAMQPATPARASSAPRTGAAAAAVRPAESHGRSGYRVVVALLLVLALVAAWGWNGKTSEEATPAPAPAAASTVRSYPAPARSAPPYTIDLGSPVARVRAVHGEPVSGWEQRWEYGPSWIAFRCGLVSDWYSSPLRPLKVATARPSASTLWSPPKNCKE
jgi:hypothetical protein